MPHTHRRLALPSAFLAAFFLMAGCTTKETVTATPATEPAAASTGGPATTTPATPEASTPAGPVATPPSEPAPSTPTEPVATAPTVPEAGKPVEPEANETLTLKPGQSGTVAASTTLHYVRMINDSRCPPDVQCIWAGEVSIELRLESGKEKQTFSMKDDGKPASVLGYSIELISIDRNHLITVRVKKV